MKFFRLKEYFLFGLVIALLASIFGFIGGGLAGILFYQEVKNHLVEFGFIASEQPVALDLVEKKENALQVSQISQEEAIIRAVEKVSDSVVSIVVTKDLPIIEEYWIFPFEEFREFFREPFDFRVPQPKERRRREISWGSGFIISEQGLILTNRHIVLDREAGYTVITTDGRRFKAEIVAKDPFHDLAFLKIQKDEEKSFPVAALGDSDVLRAGQTVIAIGNALGTFKNTVSVGVVSGLGRTIVASGGGVVETLKDVIQTDAAINRGNSGGPLLNLEGEVIGINTAIVLGAENIGFAIPVNQAKRGIEQVKITGKISHPFLGVCWVQITGALQEELNLPVNYGVLIKKSLNCPYGIFPGSAAEEAGLRVGDIILEWNGQKLLPEKSLAEMIQKHIAGDKVVLKILRNNEQKIIEATLDERRDI